MQINIVSKVSIPKIEGKGQNTEEEEPKQPLQHGVHSSEVRQGTGQQHWVHSLGLVQQPAVQADQPLPGSAFHNLGSQAVAPESKILSPQSNTRTVVRDSLDNTQTVARAIIRQGDDLENSG